jgi:RimJ/RimL family protein N-acetyltransferase
MPPITFRPLAPEDLPMLHEWMCRPHVAEWWGGAPASYEETVADYQPYTEPGATTVGFIALEGDVPIGFVQVYVVAGSGEGWWPEETDPGARGIDQLLCDADRLGQGLGSRMVRAIVEHLFRDPAVTKVQTDPKPCNARAIGCYRKAGFEAVGEVETPDGRALLMIRRR